MTKEEAIKAMQTHRVRHRYFSKEEWVTQCTNGMLCLEDGVVCDPEEFWRWRQGPEWDDGWEIIPNPERSAGQNYNGGRLIKYNLVNNQQLPPFAYMGHDWF